MNGIDYAFRWCPAGEFMMGSPESEEGHFLGLDDETQHRVKLTKGFWMLETEVTQQMWESVMGTSIQEQRDKWDKDWPLVGVGPTHPMYLVNWEEATEFCRKLTSLANTGTFSLPTEAQWEYACRAGTKGEFGRTGNLDDMGWYSGNSGDRTHEVKTKDPNAWGLYDMHGNVWEWCQDRYDEDYYKNSPNDDPIGSDTSSVRVCRGGGYCFDAWLCRSASRFYLEPFEWDNHHGFRVSLVR